MYKYIEKFLCVIAASFFLFSCSMDNNPQDVNLSDQSSSNNEQVTPADSNLNSRVVWEETFTDDFNGSALDESKWHVDIGGWGWGNSELQYYRKENIRVSGGFLEIIARRENYDNKSFTSARITTAGKYPVKYGKVSARMKLPKGTGMWPAFWMLGNNIGTASWPGCGEIDIMEMMNGGEPGADKVALGTAHWWHEDINGYATYGEKHYHWEDLGNNFHEYTLIWDEQYLRVYIDDHNYWTMDISDRRNLSEFHQDFHLLINLAVGGDKLTPKILDPAQVTSLPNYGSEKKLIVDWVKVWRKAEAKENGPVALKAVANSRYVCAENFGWDPIVARAESANDWETFNLVNNSDGTVSLQSHANWRYLQSPNWGWDAAGAWGEAVGDWEKYRLINNSDGTVSFQSIANDRYLQTSDFGWGNIGAWGEAIGDWEKFHLEYR